MDVSRETPDVTTKPTYYDSTYMLVRTICIYMPVGMQSSSQMTSRMLPRASPVRVIVSAYHMAGWAAGILFPSCCFWH